MLEKLNNFLENTQKKFTCFMNSENKRYVHLLCSCTLYHAFVCTFLLNLILFILF